MMTLIYNRRCHRKLPAVHPISSSPSSSAPSPSGAYFAHHQQHHRHHHNHQQQHQLHQCNCNCNNNNNSSASPSSSSSIALVYANNNNNNKVIGTIRRSTNSHDRNNALILVPANVNVTTNRCGHGYAMLLLPATKLRRTANRRTALSSSSSLLLLKLCLVIMMTVTIPPMANAADKLATITSIYNNQQQQDTALIAMKTSKSSNAISNIDDLLAQNQPIGTDHDDNRDITMVATNNDDEDQLAWISSPSIITEANNNNNQLGQNNIDHRSSSIFFPRRRRQIQPRSRSSTPITISKAIVSNGIVTSWPHNRQVLLGSHSYPSSSSSSRQQTNYYNSFHQTSSSLSSTNVIECGPLPDIAGAHIVAKHLARAGGTVESNNNNNNVKVQIIGVLYDWLRFACDDPQTYEMVPAEGAVVVCRKIPDSLRSSTPSDYQNNNNNFSSLATAIKSAFAGVWAFSPTLADAGIPNLPVCLPKLSINNINNGDDDDDDDGDNISNNNQQQDSNGSGSSSNGDIGNSDNSTMLNNYYEDTKNGEAAVAADIADDNLLTDDARSVVDIMQTPITFTETTTTTTTTSVSNDNTVTTTTTTTNNNNNNNNNNNTSQQAAVDIGRAIGFETTDYEKQQTNEALIQTSNAPSELTVTTTATLNSEQGKEIAIEGLDGSSYMISLVSSPEVTAAQSNLNSQSSSTKITTPPIFLPTPSAGNNSKWNNNNNNNRTTNNNKTTKAVAKTGRSHLMMIMPPPSGNLQQLQYNNYNQDDLRNVPLGMMMASGSNRANRGLAPVAPSKLSITKASKKLAPSSAKEDRQHRFIKQAAVNTTKIQQPTITCGVPPDIPYSVVLAERIADGFRIGRPYDWVRYGCQDGFHMLGSDVVVCLLTGRWMNAKESLPVCVLGLLTATSTLLPAQPPSAQPSTITAAAAQTTATVVPPVFWTAPVISRSTAARQWPSLPQPQQYHNNHHHHHHNQHNLEQVLARLFGLIDEWSRTGHKPNALTSPLLPSMMMTSPGRTVNSLPSSTVDTTTMPTMPTIPTLRSSSSSTRGSTAATSSRGSQSWPVIDSLLAHRLNACGPPPPIPDAMIIASSLKTEYDFGYPRDWVQYECPERFSLYSSDTVICMPDGRWMNEYETLPLCIAPGDCPPPPAMPLSTVDYSSLIPGSKATYYCSDEKDYAMVGRSNVAVCQRNATWTSVDFECLLTSLPRPCDKPPLIRYGRIVQEARYGNFGWSVSYVCDTSQPTEKRVLWCHPYRGWGKPPKCPIPPDHAHQTIHDT